MHLNTPRAAGHSRRVGLSISDSSVHAVEVSGRGRSSVVVARAASSLPPGVVVHGAVRDADAFATVLNELWSSGGLRSRHVIAGVGPHESFVRAVEIPKVSKRLREGALEFELQDMLPFPAAEAVIDYRPVQAVSGEDVDGFLVIASHAPSLRPLIQSFGQTRMKLHALDVPAFAAVRGVDALDEVATGADEGPRAVVAVGADLLTVTIHTAGEVRFTRQVQVNAGMESGLSDALETELSTINAHVGSPLGATRQPGRDPIVDAVRTTIEFEGQAARTAPVTGIDVFGAGPVATSLYQGLAADSDVPVSRVGRWPSQSGEMPLDADWIALGHGIEASSTGPPWPRILPDRTRERRRNTVLLAGAAAVVGAVVGTGVVFALGPDVSTAAAEVESLEVQLAAVDARLDDAGEAVLQSDELNQATKSAEEIRASVVDWEGILEAIRTGEPAGSTTLSVVGTGPDALSGDAAGLRVSVESSQPTAVSDWLALLSSIDALGDPVLESVTATAVDPGGAVSSTDVFSIYAQIGDPPASGDDLGEATAGEEDAVVEDLEGGLTEGDLPEDGS